MPRIPRTSASSSPAAPSPAIVAYRYRTQPTGTARTLALTISRYTPQKVMLATVDEARYRVLLTEDGKALIEARLAVRNNQRSFLGVTLPAGATLWSAAIDGRTIRPGRGQGDSLLLPLQKRRAGEDARPSSSTWSTWTARPRGEPRAPCRWRCRRSTSRCSRWG